MHKNALPIFCHHRTEKEKKFKIGNVKRSLRAVYVYGFALQIFYLHRTEKKKKFKIRNVKRSFRAVSLLIGSASSQECLPIRSEHCQNTKFSRSRHWKWQAVIDEKFTHFTIINNEDADRDSMITNFNATVTKTAREILENPVRNKQTNKQTGSLQTFLTCATKGENWERKESNLKDLRNTGEWTTTWRNAWKRQRENWIR